MKPFVKGPWQVCDIEVAEDHRPLEARAQDDVQVVRDLVALHAAAGALHAVERPEVVIWPETR